MVTHGEEHHTSRIQGHGAAQTAQRRHASLLLQCDVRLALEPCVHLAQQLVSSALDLRAENGEAEHEVTKQGRLGRGA